jgi:hypothetical protein
MIKFTQIIIAYSEFTCNLTKGNSAKGTPISNYFTM